MKRYRDDRPADICFARGTFNSHPYVMGAMAAFLERLETPEVQALYRPGRLERPRDASTRGWRPSGAGGQPVLDLDGDLHPPRRYNWMLQYYLRAEGWP
jgi:glutamate-1-semialdehyde 2,1-aminomutase